MKPAAVAAFMAREYPGLEVLSTAIQLSYNIRIVGITRSSRGSLLGFCPFGGAADLAPTEENLRTAIETGLQRQIDRHRSVVDALTAMQKPK